MNKTVKEPNRLQLDLANRILQLARHEMYGAGHRLSEHRLAKALSVSRTPIRAALGHLHAKGVVNWAAGDGFSLAGSIESTFDFTPPNGLDPSDALIAEIARDRLDQRLPDQASEADLIRRYKIARSALLRALAKLAEVGLVERNVGYGWRFKPVAKGRELGLESYSFRCLIEPAGLLEPGFKPSQQWMRQMREAHEAALNMEWRPGASIAFFEMNAAFHEGLAEASGNRFFHAAIQQQNRLRRFQNYDWTYGVERVVVSTREHLEILDEIERGDLEVASLKMRRHLGGAAQIKR